MNRYANTLDMSLETDEFITAEEYMRRRERGEINPREVTYASGDPDTGYVGGFLVKLKQPRYRVNVKPCREGYPYV